MSVQQDLLDLGDLFNFFDLSTFTQNTPVEWVASALDLSTQATIRRRRLPTDQVLWPVLGVALFRDEPVHEAARRLNICAQGLSGYSPFPIPRLALMNVLSHVIRDALWSSADLLKCGVCAADRARALADG
jgi:hypothetical protein